MSFSSDVTPHDTKRFSTSWQCLVVHSTSRAADRKTCKNQMKYYECYLRISYDLTWSNIRWPATIYINAKSRAGSYHTQQRPIVTTRLDLRQSLPRKRPVMTSWLHLPRTLTPHACLSLHFPITFSVQKFLVPQDFHMFSRINQVARHLSRPLPNYLHRSAAAATTRLTSSPAIMADANNKRTINTAACLIIGDEVLGGKVCQSEFLLSCQSVPGTLSSRR
jgi:hypothetical protein